MTQDLLNFLTFRNLGFECLGLLLELHDGAQALVWIGQGCIAFSRDNVRVLSTNFEELLGVGGPGKAAQGVRAKEREGMHLHEIVPELLELERSILIPLCPQERDHLPKGTHAWIPATRLRDNPSNHVSKTPGIRIAIDHELRQCLGRIQRDILSLCAHGHEVHSVRLESCFQVIPMRWRGDYDSRLPAREPGAREAPHRIEEVGILFVQMNKMVKRTDVAPVRARHRGLKARSLCGAHLDLLLRSLS